MNLRGNLQVRLATQRKPLLDARSTSVHLRLLAGPFAGPELALGPVHTNPFSNENGAVLLRFQKDLRPHLSFSYRFRLSTLQCVSVRMLK